MTEPTPDNARLLTDADKTALMQAAHRADVTGCSCLAVFAVAEQIVKVERERIARQCQTWAVERFDEHGPLDTRGATLWNVAAWIWEGDDA